MENKCVPEVRFRGFSEEWKRNTLASLGNIMTGSTPSTKDISNYSSDGIIWVTPTDINSNIVTQTAKRLSKNGQLNARIVPPGTILVTCIASIGKNAMVESKASFNQQINALTPNSFNDSYFLLTQSELWSKKMKQIAGSGIMQIINKTVFSNIEILTPELEEQRNIGAFFKQLDDTIALHQQELIALKQTKQGFLQKMFPKAGESVPEIRFPGFSGDWELLNLGEIFNILDGDRGKNYPGESDFYKNGQTLFLDTGNVKKNGFNFSTKKYITKEKDALLRNGKLELHDFVLTSRGTLGNVAYYDETTRNNNPSIRINSAMLILRPVMRNQVSDDYMAAVLRGNIIDSFMSTKHVGSAQPHITKRDFSRVSVGIPSIFEEQTRIGNFFKKLDDLITLEQRELDVLKATKKAFLQKMFV